MNRLIFVYTAATHDCREKVRPGPVERLAWAMQEIEQWMEQLPRERKDFYNLKNLIRMALT
jgi:hypothetical protein